MHFEPNEIEISFPVEMSASVAFAVDRDTWAAMSDDDKRALIVKRVEQVAIHIQVDMPHFEASDHAQIDLAAEILDPADPALVDLAQVRSYDPAE